MASFAASIAEAQELARHIALCDGGVLRVTESLDALHAELRVRASVPEVTTVWSGGNAKRYTSKIVTVAPQTRYTARPTEVRQRFPEAYQAALRVSTPEFAYQVRLEKAGRGTSTEWEALRAQGAATAASVLAGRFGKLDWHLGNQMAVLKQLRLDVKGRELRAKMLRQEFVTFVTERELWDNGRLVVPMFGDGRVRLQANTPKETLDIAILRTFPEAAALIRSHELAGYTYVDFHEIKDDPDEELAD